MTRDAVIVFEFAYTTGELYPRHVKLALENATLGMWKMHVTLYVIPRFKSEMRLNSSNWAMSDKDKTACAEMLQSYYSNHVKEL